MEASNDEHGTRISVSVSQSLILALVHAAAVAGIVYATMRGQIHTTQANLATHVAQENRHGNQELINFRLSEIQRTLAELQREIREDSPNAPYLR